MVHSALVALALVKRSNRLAAATHASGGCDHTAFDKLARAMGNTGDQVIKVAKNCAYCASKSIRCHLPRPCFNLLAKNLAALLDYIQRVFRTIMERWSLNRFLLTIAAADVLSLCAAALFAGT